MLFITLQPQLIALEAANATLPLHQCFIVPRLILLVHSSAMAETDL